MNSSSRTAVIAAPPMKKNTVMVIANRMAMRLWSVVVSQDVERRAVSKVVGSRRERQFAGQQARQSFCLLRLRCQRSDVGGQALDFAVVEQARIAGHDRFDSRPRCRASAAGSNCGCSRRRP